MTLAFTPGKRLVFNRCTLIKRTNYERTFRGETRLIWRHAFKCPFYDGHSIVYSGDFLPMLIGQTRDIKGTVKNEFEGGQNYATKFLHISRPRLLDVKTLPLIEGLSEQTKG